ncbi:SRPBCC family protein [Fulvivirga sp. M361]|uniref:SRPBCC family protein n=1 Tax=Fulvivirga sp. M361 TaxID=2594266 RepID=UPI002105E383|nr:SRPBCC family protein [Fulvivirga sp. M361]
MALQAQENEQSNKHFWHTSETSASPEKIWSIWTDVPHWKQWDSGLKDATLEGAFTINSKGVITSLEGRRSKFKIIAFEKGRSYTLKTKLPLGSLYVKRYLNSDKGKTVFTHEVWFKGLTKGIFARAFGSKFRNMLPEVLDNIKRRAEK